MTTQLISRDFHGAKIRQRSSDGYLNATDMCQAVGKLFADYKRLKTTQEYFETYALTMGIPIIKIIEVKSGRYGGTWIHPKVAIHLAIWCDPHFAVMVSEWVYELLTTGSVSLAPKQEIATFAQAKADELDQLGLVGNAKQIALNNSIKQQFGCDMLQLFGIESTVAKIQQALLIPTEIAKRVDLKNARPVNVKLIEFGLQTKHRDNKKRLYYQLTEEGIKHGQYQDTSKKHNSGTPVRTIKWFRGSSFFPKNLNLEESVLQFFQALPVSKVFKLT
jgi:hypothetical protein